MNLLQNILGRFGLATQSELQMLRKDLSDAASVNQIRQAVTLMTRAYAAAQQGRLTADWTTVTGNPLADIRAVVKPVRDRARDLKANDPTGHHIISTWKLNVPGPKGFSFKSKALMSDNRTSDEAGNKAVEAAYYDWSKKKHCSVTGTMSRRMIEHFIMTQLGRDGEFLLRKVYNNSKYGFQLQPLDVELLDETYNERRGGNIIVMGVEIDKWGKPQAYWIKVPSEISRLYGYNTSATRERIPADQIYHGFDFEYACQTRGVSWLAPIMLRSKGLSDFEGYSWLAAKLQASVGLFFKNQSGAMDEPQMTGDSTDADNRVEMEFGPAMVKDIGNKALDPFTPTYPHQLHEPFVDSMMSRIGQGVDMSNHTLTMDASKANFSSARFSAANDQEAYRSHQELLKESFLEPMYEDWLLMAMMKSEIRLESGAVLPVDRYEKFAAAGTFTGRTWGFIQPMQDIMAAVVAMEYGLQSPIEWYEERGKDMYEVYSDIKAAKDLREKLGIDTKFEELEKSITAIGESGGNGEPGQAEKIKSAVRNLADVMLEIDAAEHGEDEAALDAAEEKLITQVRTILKRKTNGHHQHS